MATQDQVPGTWTVWVRTKSNPTTTAYTATFTAPPGQAHRGDVTLTLGTASYTGQWQSTDNPEDEHVHFQVQDLLEAGKEARFSGYLVGLAMGGPVRHKLLEIFPFGAWAAYKTSD